MDEGTPRKPVKVSDEYEEHLSDIFDYTLDTFGEVQALRYMKKIRDAVDMLPDRTPTIPPVGIFRPRATSTATSFSTLI